MTRSFTARHRELAGLRISAQRIGAASAGAAPVAGARPADEAQIVSAVAETVRRMLAVQAQDLAGAVWSVGLRTPGSTVAGVESALATGAVVRSWPMRGTLHLVPPEDLGWMLSLTSARTLRSIEARRRALGLSTADIELVREVAHRELEGGRVLSRDALLAAFDAAGVATSDQRGYHLLLHLGITRTIVFGPPEGSRQTFALLDDRVPSPRLLEREEALGEFALRYFGGHGPATVHDFAWWSSLTLADARTGLAVARDSLDELVVDDTAYFLAPGTSPAPRGVHALPGFDEYLLGYRDRSAPLAGGPLELVAPGKNGLFLSTVVVDGEVVGTWRRTLSARGVSVDVRPFGALSAAARGRLDGALGRYAAFLGRTLLTPG